MNRGAQYLRAVAQAKQLFEQKNKEYGDAIVYGGMVGAAIEFIGIAARMRQVVLLDGGLTDEKKLEILHDKALDAINYGVIMLMMEEEGNYCGEDIDVPELSPYSRVAISETEVPVDDCE